MIDLDKIGRTLDAMIECERTIGRLYGVCARRWGKDGFWKSLEDQEYGHAEALEKVKALVAAAPSQFDAGRPFNEAATKTMMNYIESNRKELESGALTELQFLARARDIEKALLEDRYLEVVQSGNKEFKDLMFKVMEETRRHRSLVTQRMASADKPA